MLQSSCVYYSVFTTMAVHGVTEVVDVLDELASLFLILPRLGVRLICKCDLYAKIYGIHLFII